MDFYTLLTNNGKGSITRSYAMSTPLHLTTFAVGDGGDGYYDPDITQTSLINETYRGNISKIYVDTDYENRLIVECAIPSDSGGYYIREVGIFDSNKNLFAIGRLPESYKPIGDPEYILLSIDIKEKALVITPSIQLDIKAHYIGKYLHNHEKSIVLYSKPLMETFKDINKNLLSNKSYKLYGVISKDKKCVKFKIHEAILIN